MAKLPLSLAALAVSATTVLAPGLVAPASAHESHGDYSWGVRLGERAENTIDARNVGLAEVGTARVKTWDDDVFVSFPVVGTRYTRTSGYDRDRITLLAGGVRFRGAQTETWRRLRVNEETNRVTALVDGVRRPVLRFADECGGFGSRGTWDGDHRGTALRLTRAGQASLDRAAGANVFWRGEVFAWAR